MEGSIAKYFATETGDSVANDGIQAFGGYGYIREYEVEKIKRDARILPIYEGTSEIQRNIISMFRMRNTVRSKGRFYHEMAQTLGKLPDETGGPIVSEAIGMLNEIILGSRENKVTKYQFVMFLLADMMTWCEIAKALCLKAENYEGSGKRSPDFVKTCARLFAREAFERVIINGLKISRGCDMPMEELSAKINNLNVGKIFEGGMKDMDYVAEELLA